MLYEVITSGFQGTQALLNLKVPPTAIIASNDLMAFGAMDAAKTAGLIAFHKNFTSFYRSDPGMNPGISISRHVSFFKLNAVNLV